MTAQNRTFHWLAWLVAGISGVLSVLAIFLAAIDPPEPVLPTVGVTLILALPYPIAGVVIAGRFPRNPIGWIFGGVGLFQAINIFTEQYGRYAILARPGSLPFANEFYWVSEWTWFISIALLVTYLLLLFPDGRVPAPAWRWVGWLAGFSLIFTTVLIAAAVWPTRGLPAICGQYTTEPNQAALDRLCTPQMIAAGDPGASSLVWVGFGLVGLSALGSLSALIFRFVRSRGIERAQLKWIVFAGVLILIGVAGLFTVSLETIPGLLSVLALLSIPVAVTVAILRYHLWDIDLIIRRTLTYSVLTAVLAAIYFGSVLLFQAIFTRITGPQSQISIVISTLLLAVLFTPLRHWIQGFIDRRFFRRRYDLERILAAFAAAQRDVVNLDQLSGQLVEIIAETIEPESVSLWIRRAHKA